MARKLVDVLEEQGMSLNLQAGGEAPKEMVEDVYKRQVVGSRQGKQKKFRCVCQNAPFSPL